MATSGQVKTNTEYESYFWVKWEQVGNQDIPNNRTQIKWTCGLYSEHKFRSNAIKMSAFSINGTQVYSGGTYSNFLEEGDQPIASGTMWINHNADGKKTFSISSFTGWLYSNHNYSCGGGSFTLTDIPRKATITAASNFTDLDNPTITFSNPGGFTMDVWLELNPVGDHLCVKNNIPNTGSYTWSLTEAERNALRDRCPGTSCTVRLGLYSYVGGTQYADYKDMTFTIKESDATRPTVSMEVTLNNGTLPSTFADMYIQGKSKVRVKLNATGKNNAKITSYQTVIDGKWGYNGQDITSDVLQKSGNLDIVGYAKDSREFRGSVKKSINVMEYSKPLVNPIGSENAILCYRSDGNGKRTGSSTSVWVKAKRFYYNLSKRNTCALQYRVKPVSYEWDDSVHKWKDLIPSSSTTDEYNALISGVVFDLKQSYTVQIRAIDSLNEYDIRTFEIPTQDVALHLGKGGKNVSIGTYCDYSEERTFYSDWKAIFDKEVFIGGTQVVDHIVEEGTSGIWTYRKWNSGIAECWGISEKVSAPVDTAWGSVYAKDHVIQSRPYPFTFASQPVANIITHEHSNNFWVFVGKDGTTSQTPTVSVVRPTLMEVTLSVNYYVIGRWK